MLQGKNIQIFQITGKSSAPYNSIEFSVHKPISYLQTTANKMFLANEPPFNHYKVGDHLAVDLDKTSLHFPNAERGKIRNESAIVTKVVKKDLSTPYYKVFNVYQSEDFEGEWVEV